MRAQLVAELIAEIRERASEVEMLEAQLLQQVLQQQLGADNLQHAEDAILLMDPCPLDGKNERTREAQLRALTMTTRNQLELADREVLRTRSALRVANAHLSALKQVAALFSRTATEEPVEPLG